MYNILGVRVPNFVNFKLRFLFQSCGFLVAVSVAVSRCGCGCGCGCGFRCGRFSNRNPESIKAPSLIRQRSARKILVVRFDLHRIYVELKTVAL